MNIRQIEVFRQIMEAGSVTEAATRLHISQPSVSKHLKHLELALGFDLFTRTGNQLIATTEAMALYDQVQQVYAGVDSLARFAEDLKHNRRGEIAVAAMPSIAHRWLPERVAAFAQDRPDVSFSLPVRSTDWIARAVAAGRVDLGIGLTRERAVGIVQRSLLRLPLVCVCREDHPLAAAKAVEPSDLREHDVISLNNFDRQTLNLDSLFQEVSDRHHRRFATFSTHVACELARSGCGVSVVDMLSAMDHLGDGLVARPLTTEIRFDLSLMQPSNWPSSRLTEALAETLSLEARLTQKSADAMAENLLTAKR